MLSKTDNELITRVGPGTPMGNLMRQYWMPVLFSWELEQDGPPERVRLVGEDLIAFRDSSGQPGMIAANCPHRGASLFFGRNEEDGLRCVYHGWKFDIGGRCVDMPSEPAESNFKDKVRAVAYPCEERGGVIWTYMGSLTPPPPLPDLEWMSLPEEHRFMAKRVQDSNWLQAIEGEIDQSHVSFLHSYLNPTDGPASPIGGPRTNVALIRAADKHPRFETVETDYGVMIGSGREAGDDMRYWRVTQLLMPFHTMTGPYGPNPTRGWRCWVPIDDTHVYVMGATFHPLKPFTAEERERMAGRANVFYISPSFQAPKTSEPFGRWKSIATLENDFFIDRDAQRTKTYSGISEFWAQDAGPQLSMGPIYDRSKEHLGTSDLGIIAARRRYLREARALQEHGTVPDTVLHPEYYQVRSAAVLIPSDRSWIDATADYTRVLAGVNQDAV
jgi:nitrite reductase/ring-hydroxylating ferredoxin subunit